MAGKRKYVKTHFSKKLDIELQRAHDNRDIEEYIRVKRFRTEKSPFEKYRDLFMRHLVRSRPRLGKVLDIGSNIGDMARHYQGRADRIVLCDFDEFIIRAPRMVNPDIGELDPVCADMQNLPFKDGVFDTVLSLETIEHVSEKEGRVAIGEIIRVARPGAVIYLSTPNRFSLSGLEGRMLELFVKGYRWNAWDPAHKHIYYSWDFMKLIHRFSGAVRIKEVYGSYFLPGSSVIRLPGMIQRFLGSLSYFIARSVGNIFPFKYAGFTIITVLEKI